MWCMKTLPNSMNFYKLLRYDIEMLASMRYYKATKYMSTFNR